MTTTNNLAEALRGLLRERNIAARERARKFAESTLAAYEAQAEAKPAEPPVWEVSGKFGTMLFATEAAADAWCAGFPPSVSGGFEVVGRHVHGAAPAAPAEPTLEMLKAGAAEWLKYGEREACYPLAQGFDKLTPEDAIRRSRLTHVYRAMLAAIAANKGGAA